MKRKMNKKPERQQMNGAGMLQMIHGHFATLSIYAAVRSLFMCGIAFCSSFSCVACAVSVLGFHRVAVVIFLNPVSNIYGLINCHGVDIVQ